MGTLQLRGQIESAVAELLARLNGIEAGQLAALERADAANATTRVALERVMERVAALETSLARLGGAQAAAALEIAQVEERLSGLFRQDLRSSGSATATQLTELTQRLHELSSRVAGMERGIDRIEKVSESFRAIYLGRNRVLVRFRLLPLVFLVEANDRVIVPHMILDGTYEPEVTSFLMEQTRPDSICIDVGANIGYYTCIMARLAPQGRVLAIEPDPRVFSILRENIDVNWLEAVAQPECVAVGDAEGEILLYRVRQRSANTSIIAPDPATGVVPDGTFRAVCRTVDQLAGSFDHVDFLKIDVEGAEERVLRGSRRTIAANPGIRVLMEWSPTQMERAGSSPAALLGVIQELGLRVQRFRLDGTLEDASFNEMMVSPYWNVALTHPDGHSVC